MPGKADCSQLITSITIEQGSAALSPRCRCAGRGTAHLLSLLLCLVLFGFGEMFMPGYFFSLVHFFLLSNYVELFFRFSAAFKINLRHFVTFFAAVVVFVVVAQFVLVFTVITQHTIFDVRTNSISAAL
jgi:hypothetical protein